jgi:hypothetical protein
LAREAAEAAAAKAAEPAAAHRGEREAGHYGDMDASHRAKQRRHWTRTRQLSAALAARPRTSPAYPCRGTKRRPRSSACSTPPASG